MSGLDIAVDMDGVLCDFTTAAIKAAKHMFNVELTYEEMIVPYFAKYVWGKLSEEERRDFKLATKQDIYSILCGPGFFYNLEPFEHAIDGVKKLYAAGHNIIFLTKPLNWQSSSYDKSRWLQKYFYDIDYSLIMISTMESKHLVDGAVIIDDDPRALNHPSAYDICMARPWNMDFRSQHPDVVVVNDMLEAAGIIEALAQNLLAIEPY